MGTSLPASKEELIFKVQTEGIGWAKSIIEDERKLEILRLKIQQGLTLGEIAVIVNLSYSRTQQLYQSALTRLYENEYSLIEELGFPKNNKCLFSDLFRRLKVKNYQELKEKIKTIDEYSIFTANGERLHYGGYSSEVRWLSKTFPEKTIKTQPKRRKFI